MIKKKQTTAVKTELDRLRSRLLDLTFRNRLLKYRPSKQRTLKIIDEKPHLVFRTLVEEEREMGFLPLRRERAYAGNDFSDDDGDDKQSALWGEKSAVFDLDESCTDNKLRTDCEADKLNKRLFYINQKAREVMEEQGYSVLFLALGFLKWQDEKQGERDLLAPLVLVPIELVRTRAGRTFRLRWTGDEVQTNLSLKERLKDQAVELPEAEALQDVQGFVRYFQKVAEAIHRERNWAVTEEICLDFFSFTKFVMYKDLDTSTWPENMQPWDSHLLASVLSPSSEGGAEHKADMPLSDARIDWRNVHHVLDADPSQIAVINRVSLGNNLVVEGPPGTGKSQTITNVIAELLARGKTVLFVSEKMAALEVVKSRLDHAGLGFACLELHSRKTQKREFLSELKRAINYSHTATFPASSESLYEQIQELRRSLNDYSLALRETIGTTGKNPYQLFGMFEKAQSYFDRVGKPLPRTNFPQNMELTTHKDLNSALNVLDRFSELFRVVAPTNRHPWRAFDLGLILPKDQENAHQALAQCLESLDRLTGLMKAICEMTGIPIPESPAMLSSRKKVVTLLASSPDLPNECIDSPLWASQDHITYILKTVTELQSEKAYIDKRFRKNAFEIDKTREIDEFESLSKKIFRFFNKRYRNLRRELMSHYKESMRISNSEIITDFQRIANYARKSSKLAKLERAAKAAMGSYWEGEKTAPEALSKLIAWVSELANAFKEGAIDKNVFAALNKTGLKKAEIKHTWKTLCDSQRELVAQIKQFLNSNHGDFSSVFSMAPGEVTFGRISSVLKNLIENIDRMQEWSEYLHLRAEGKSTIAAPLLSLADADSLSADDLLPCFDANYAEALLNIGFRKRAALQRFTRETHEGQRRRFAEMDQTLIRLTRKRVAIACREHIPSVKGGACPDSEVGILMGQIQRKRGHMPIRRLLGQAGGLIQKIKPCFMMSPLSIAQYLDPRTTSFDAIVFDEASQVRPEDGVGAILRGKQLVVVGDTKQLPPTSFFDIDRLIDDDEDGLVVAAADVESILHQCLRSFDTERLKWHYRSRHHSLIAVSNFQFYDNELNVFPSPTSDTKKIGLQFCHVPEGIYGRGKSQTNPVEAQKIVDALFQHLEELPNKSIGIGTFNIKQQQRIQEEIELRLINRPEFEPYFSSERDEPVFVKNLETIQGDERDIILISVCYGLDVDKRLTGNFGPVNKEGGHRRLNVLFTRAREKCIIFSNFRARDLQLPASAGYGLQSLKMFLEYAEKGSMPEIPLHSDDSGSPFEDSVYDFLRNSGYNVHKQVGCAGYRIDLAIVDDKHPGDYILGIECDGHRYHTSVMARERDRLRQQVLEDKGWAKRIYRIWSTDWYRHRQKAKEDLLKAVQIAKLLPSYEIRAAREEKEESAAEVAPPEAKPEAETDYGFIDYESFEPSRIVVSSTFWGEPIPAMAELIQNIVSIESPVHIQVVNRRIRDAYEIGKVGPIIREKIKLALAHACEQKWIWAEKDFLYSPEQDSVRPRRREEKELLKADLISGEEVHAGIVQVLTREFATPKEGLAKLVANGFGFRSVSKQTSRHMRVVIQRMLNEGKLQEDPSGRVKLIKRG